MLQVRNGWRRLRARSIDTAIADAPRQLPAAPFIPHGAAPY